MIVLDGSTLEGGGQIVRTALALSTLTGIPVEVSHIRSGRSQGGLKHQHLYCIEALQKLCDAKVNGASLGSTSIRYSPGAIKGGTITVDIGTAGSIALLLQGLILPCLFAPSKVRLRITGGTCGLTQMPVEFYAHVVEPQLTRFVQSIETRILRPGYYPKGGGSIAIDIVPKLGRPTFESFVSYLSALRSQTRPYDLVKRGHLIQIRGISHASSELENSGVATRQAEASRIALAKFGVPVRIDHVYQEASCVGSGITLWAIFSPFFDEIDLQNPCRLGADALGEKGRRAEDVGVEAATRLQTLLCGEAAVDEHTEDTLIPYLALAGGAIRCPTMTLHTKTNLWVCEQFLGKVFRVDGKIISVGLP